MQIGVPRILCKYLLMLPSSRLYELALPLLERTPLSILMKWTGCNRVWVASVHVLRGAIELNATRLGHAFTIAHSTLHLAAQAADGLQSDGSFHQHGSQLYSGWGGYRSLLCHYYIIVYAQCVPRTCARNGLKYVYAVVVPCCRLRRHLYHQHVGARELRTRHTVDNPGLTVRALRSPRPRWAGTKQPWRKLRLPRLCVAVVPILCSCCYRLGFSTHHQQIETCGYIDVLG